MAEEEKGTSAWFRVPTWDGNPSTWRAFKKEMAWWTSSLNQGGAVRARGEEFEPSELMYQKGEFYEDPTTKEKIEITKEDPLAGLNKLLKALESLNGKTDLDRKGELRSSFYLELKRKAGERF